MHASNTSRSSAVFAMLLAASALLAACDQVVSTANAQVSAPSVSTASVYFGDEYYAVQKTLVADATPQPPTF